jgi:DNA-binding CsgD family transcriptional regulator/PAS domain-containing protein
MRLLSDPDFLSQTIGRIYDCVLRPEAWQELISSLAEMLEARRAFLGLSDANGQTLAISVTHNIAADAALERYSRINPILPIGLTWPYDKAFVVSRDYGLEAFQATRYHREYLAPRGDRDAIAFLATREGSALGHWLIVTQDDRGPITEAEAKGLELVAPHLRRAVEISKVLGVQQLSAETYRASLDQLEAAVMILDHHRRPTYANPRAIAALEAGTLLRLTGGRLLGTTPQAEAALRRAWNGPGGRESLVAGTDGEERLLFTVSLKLGRQGRLGQEERSTMLVLRSPREDTRNPVAIAARLFRLTPAQVQVLAFLAQGHAPEAIAEILGLGLATVRSHLADLFRRTDTARQAELVARTLSLAVPLQAGEAEDRRT